MPKTQLILAVIFRDYLSTNVQKEKIIKFENYQLEKLEEEARKKYNPNNIFKNKKIMQEENTDLIEIHKITILSKILNKIKIFLYRK